MRIARFFVGDRSFELSVADVELVMGAVAGARGRDEWVEIVDARGSLLRLLIPSDMLLLIHEEEVSEIGERQAFDSSDWPGFDFD